MLAYLDQRTAALEDLGVALAAVAAAGPEVALVARNPAADINQLTALAARCVANATPPGARVLVTGRADVALATGANGVVLRTGDLSSAEIRDLAGDNFAIIASVSSEAEAARASEEGADAVIMGNIWPTTSHPGRPPAGVELVTRVAAFGIPVYAIGGVTPERAREARIAGAWGIAAITSLWDAADRYKAALEMVEAVQ